jgi:catechol 2,3-dioxygenase-like lactoylglutathione lyase family enzyme
MTAIGTDVIVQVGIVVADLEAALHRYAAVFGLPVPPISETRSRQETGILYRGRPTEARARLAFFRMGQVAIELIEPLDGPSTWREHLEAHGPGVHHIAFQVPSMDQALAHLADHRIEVVQQASFRSGRYAYLDSRDALSVMLELLEIRS